MTRFPCALLWHLLCHSRKQEHRSCSRLLWPGSWGRRPAKYEFAVTMQCLSLAQCHHRRAAWVWVCSVNGHSLLTVPKESWKCWDFNSIGIKAVRSNEEDHSSVISVTFKQKWESCLPCYSAKKLSLVLGHHCSLRMQSLPEGPSLGQSLLQPTWGVKLLQGLKFIPPPTSHGTGRTQTLHHI